MSKRYCVVTPYYQETRPILERCVRSVAAQTVAVDHLMVADGHPQEWLDGEPVRHLRLDRSHGDFGNAARGLGAMLAVAEKYDAIAFLDADNWYDPDHVETCLAAAATSPNRPDFVAAQRHFVRPDESIMPLMPHDQPFTKRIDTNCYFFLPMSYHVISRWCTIPREMSQHGDELFSHVCLAEKLSFALTDHRTVNYTCLFETCYQFINEPPPPGAKPPVNWHETQQWLDGLTPEELALVQRQTGFLLRNS